MEISRDGRVKARTASDQVAHSWSQSVVHFAEKDGARVDPDFAQSAVERNHRGENFLRNRPPFRDLLKQTLVNQVEELRHDRECSDVALAQSPQQFSGVERFQPPQAVEANRVKRCRVAKTKPGPTRFVVCLAGAVEVSSSNLSNPNRLIVERRAGS